jgi:hypothetical protein
MAYNFQTGSNKITLLTEYESETQKVLFGKAVLAALMSGRNYDVIQQNPLSKRSLVTELNIEKIHIQIMLSDVCQLTYTVHSETCMSEFCSFTAYRSRNF